MDQFSLLRVVEARLVEVNNELDSDDFFRKVRKAKNEIGAKTTTIQHKSSDGLDKDKALQQLNSAAIQGQAEISLDGKDVRGDRLKGNNDSFRVKVPLEELSGEPVEAADQMYESFSDLVAAGIVQIADIDEGTVNRIAELKRRLLP